MQKIMMEPFPDYLRKLSIEQLNRLYRRAYNRMDSILTGRDSGADPFGWWDWPTLRVVSPSWYRTLRQIRSALNMAILRHRWNTGEFYAEYDPRNHREN